MNFGRFRLTPLTRTRTNVLPICMTDTSANTSYIHLPNALTVGRIIAVPALVLCLYFLEGDVARWSAFALFVAASITDWLDGHIARTLKQQTTFGAMLDPIADKLLVAATLFMLIYDQTITGVSIFAALIILCREILVSGLREYLAGLNVKVIVTKLAKWKTVVQMVALCILLAGPAADKIWPNATNAGLVLLWAAAILTIWTGSDYLRASIHHASK